MRFSEIIGQQEAKQRLIQTVKNQRISHAQLFLGKAGYGSLPLAIAYAQYISCKSKSENDACGNCPSCVKYQKLIHPDLHFVFPVATTKSVAKNPTSDKFIEKWREAFLENPYLQLSDWTKHLEIENKQVSINVVECNEIIKKLSLKPYESEYKVMLIWMPEKLHHAAAPKLLKILEEPPNKTLFLLVAEDAEQLIPTILSRLQMLKIARISDETLFNTLSSRFDLPQEKINNVVQLAEGNYANALKIIDKNETNEQHLEYFLNWMRMCFVIQKEGVMQELLQWVEETSRIGRENQKQFLAFALRICRECLLLNYGDEALVRLGANEVSSVSKFAPFVNSANAVELTEELNAAYTEIERNINAKILFLDLSLKIAKLIRKKPEEALSS
ncbi:MAG: DNA polymerase III subunit delta [Flavobacteriales bacterium]|nr:MAG: DNA polymerase III subunit delta [Flavobacteriales bacterium]